MDECISARANYELYLVNSIFFNPSKLYQHLSALSGSKSSPGFVMDHGLPVLDPAVNAQIFNEFFNSTFSVSVFSLPPLVDLPTPSLQLSQIDLDWSDIFHALVRLDPSKAVGCDGISPHFLRCCATALSEPIAHLFVYFVVFMLDFC